MDTSMKFFEIWTKSVLLLVILYHVLISCFFFYNILFLYILRIRLEVSSLIQFFFFLITGAKSLESCLTVQPHRRQPTRLPRPWDSPGKNTWVGCHFLLQCMKVKSESEVAQSCLTLAIPWTAAYQAPPSMGFSRQEYWSGVPLPSPPLPYSSFFFFFFFLNH